MPAVQEHVGRLGTAEDGLLFTSPEGTPMRHGNFRNRVWLPALEAAGLPPIHFHDLRHTGNMLAAGTGAGLRELMDHMGHSTTRAALTYLHASDERQRAIADALSKLGASELKRRSPAPIGHATGTKAPEGFMKIIPGGRRMRSDLRREGCAPSATRTRDLLLRRHSRNVASHGSAWPHVQVSWIHHGWMWLGMALCLRSLAPRLAPGISLATLRFE
jgi:hypothetical protein